jgi:hypothetical protein
LFTGPVILAIGYELFIGWVYQPAEAVTPLTQTVEEHSP